jgi:protein-disulfide isomerase
MDRQRLGFLLAFALIFLAATTVYFVETAKESKTRFKAGYPVPTNLLPEDLLTEEEKIPTGPPTPPDIRPADPVLYGTSSSAVSIIVFGDYQSDVSRQEFTAINDAVKLVNGQKTIRVVWRDFPLYTEHSKAALFATAARCAGKAGKYKEMHNLIFSESKTYDEAELLRFVRRLGMNEQEFGVCMRDPAIPFAISQDVKDAEMHGIKGVPTIFVDGFPFIGFVDAESLATILRRNLDIAVAGS